MAGAPPLALRIERRGAWQAAVGFLVALACVAMLGWWFARAAPAPGWVGVLTIAACVGAAACGASLARIGAGDGLRWDGQRWWHARAAQEPVAGKLGVAIDLGGWMLLRFVPAGARAWNGARWIPVQRRGLEGVWHSLRCAAHAPRPHERAPG